MNLHSPANGMFQGRLKRLYHPKFITYSLICILFLLAFSPYHAILKADHVADDASYLSHGFTLGLDFNLEYEDMVADWVTPKGIAAHPIGPGMLAAPFIAAFSVIDRLGQHEVINDHHAYQYSWSFYGFVFSSIFFFWVGLNLYIRALHLLGMKLSYSHFLFISTSFGILYYVLFRPIMGHAFEFFTIALCFWSSCKVWQALEKNHYSYGHLFLCALAMILTIEIRPANINIFVLPLIVLIFGLTTKLFTNINIRQFTVCIMLLLGYALVSYLPFAFLNYSLYGMIYPSSEAMYGPNVNPVPSVHSGNDLLSVFMMLLSRIPQISVIFFSSEFGLLFSSAILFFGSLFTIYFMIFKNFTKPIMNVLSIGILGAYLGLPIVITLFWQSTGDAYAYRFLFCFFPVALLGYAFWKKSLQDQYGSFLHYPVIQKSLQVMILCFCVFGVLGNIFLGLNENLIYNNQPNGFKRPGFGAVGYNIAVAEAIPKVSTWVNLIATRTTGFFAVGLLELCHIDIQRLPLPDALAEKLDKYHRLYILPPVRVYLQVFLLGMLCIGGGIWFCRKDFNFYPVKNNNVPVLCP